MKYFSKLTIIMLSMLCSMASLKAEIYLYAGARNPYHGNLTAALRQHAIQFRDVVALNKNDSQNLYVIFDIKSIKKQDLPPYYIVYQTEDLQRVKIGPANNFFEKLAGAVAVWDYSWDNIKQYPSSVENHLYFPHNYMHADPVILPCRLPISTLHVYKKMLTYSNRLNGDISSHLPALFAHSILLQPKVIIEAGVRGGESTVALSAAAEIANAKLIGLDIDPSSRHVYAKLNNASFFCMNDLEFPAFYKDKPKPDVVFIDTSHTYQHTLEEIQKFIPLLAINGALMFHDSNVTPINGTGYVRLNNTVGSATGNTRGVTMAIKGYFGIEFNEHAYCQMNFSKEGVTWILTHYPFCNGLTIIKKMGNQ